MPRHRNRGNVCGGYTINSWAPPTRDPVTGKLEMHAPLASYMGPGTRIKWRLQQGIQPTTNADAAAKIHDIAYANVGTRLKQGRISRVQAANSIRIADERLKRECKANLKTKGPVEKMHAYLGAAGMIGKMGLEDLGFMNELKYVEPENADDDELGGGKKKKKKKKVDRVKKLRTLFKKAKV